MVYEANSYKEILRNGVVKPKSFQAMAEHCRIQKTYLSKVLNREGDLNEDQLYLALEYIGANREEREFALLLRRWERAQIPKRREELEAQISAIRTAKLKTEAHLKVEAPALATTDLTEYYLDPIFQVLHMMLTLKRYQNDPGTLAGALNLRPEFLGKTLLSLERMGLIRLTVARGQIQRAQVVRDNLHLPQDSILQATYARQMRLKAIERMNQLPANEAYSFSALFSTNARVRQKIHASFIEWLKSVQKSVQGSREEDVYQINFDLLNWS